MLPTTGFARRILAASPLVMGAALLALISFTPSIVRAQSLTLYHDFVSNPTDPSVNPFNSSHTVVGQLSGICVEDLSVDVPDDDDGNSCLSDSDCADSDDLCDFSGAANIPVALQILGTNAQDLDFANTDGSGQVSFTYSDANGPGTDTLQACADLGEGSGIDDTGATMCIDDSSQGGVEGSEDIPSNILTKDWVPTVVLTPPGAFNLTGSSHTVTATLNGVVGVCNGGIPLACTSDASCGLLLDGTCDFSGYTLGILVTSGPNSGAGTGLVSTDSKGQVSLTYPDLGGAGTDFIQACVDLPNDGDGDVAACLTDAANGGGDSPFDDIASNVASKVWSAINVVLTPAVAFNPIHVPHVVTATGSGLQKFCAGTTTACSTDYNCGGAVGSCSVAGYPVFFAVTGNCVGGNNGGAICTDGSQCNSGNCVGGPNLGQETVGTTNSSGVATGTFNSIVEGQDRIQACVDADLADAIFGLPDDVNFIECVNDAGAELDIPTNTVTKNWFANFVTGGGGVNVGSGNKKKNLQNSGIVGKAGLAGIQGDWQAVSQVSGKTVACHFNTFTSLAFSGPATGSPPSTHNTAMFTTGPGKCNDGSSPTLTVTIVDNGEGKKAKPDTLNVVSSDARFATGGTLNLATGNYQVHSIP